MFVTVCNKDYLIGFEVMLKSLIDNNPRVVSENLPFVIITNDLTPEQEDILWWEYYEKIYYLNTDNGESQFS